MADHSEHADGGVHVHIHPWQFYAGILGALLFLTVVTVAVSWVDVDKYVMFGQEGATELGVWNLVIAILIATIKASLVVLFFMHLREDSPFNALFFIGSLLFVGIFLVYTLNDTLYRGQTDPYNGVYVDPDTGLRAPGGIEGPMPGMELEPGIPAPEGAAEADHGDEEESHEGEAEEAEAEEAAAADGEAGEEAASALDAAAAAGEAVAEAVEDGGEAATDAVEAAADVVEEGAEAAAEAVEGAAAAAAEAAE